MLRSGRGFRIWVCDKPTDMRKSFDTLAALVENVLRQDPLSGHWFVFLNRRANRMKILCFEGDGYAIWSKRLEAGTFLVPRGKNELTMSELGLVLDGIEWKETARRARFRMQGDKFLASGNVLDSSNESPPASPPEAAGLGSRVP